MGRIMEGSHVVHRCLWPASVNNLCNNVVSCFVRAAPASCLSYDATSHSSWTNKLITAKDFGSVQINIGHLDEHGVYTNSYTTYALSGPVRFRVRGGHHVCQHFV